MKYIPTEKPNFRDIRKKIRRIRSAERKLKNISNKRLYSDKQIIKNAEKKVAKDAEKALANMPIE